MSKKGTAHTHFASADENYEFDLDFNSSQTSHHSTEKEYRIALGFLSVDRDTPKNIAALSWLLGRPKEYVRELILSSKNEFVDRAMRTHTKMIDTRL